MRKRDWSKLSVPELLDVAILAEEEAAGRYGEFANQMEIHHNLHAARLFREIRAREVEHLERLQQQRKAVSDSPATIGPLDLPDFIEAPSYERSHYRMGPRQIFETALQSERNAAAFYDRLAAALKDPQAKEMARDLFEEERRHVRLVEAELNKVPAAAENWEEDHDEPAAQA